MNKKLFLLPLVAMMLTSCGSKDYSVLPKGGEEFALVDEEGTEIPDAKETLAQKLARVAENTYEGLGTGIKISAGLNKLNVDVQTSNVETNTLYPQNNVNVTEDIKVNANGSASLTLNGLGGKLSGLEAAASINKLSLDVDAKVVDQIYPDDSVDVDFAFSGLSTSVYLKDGNIYVDLSNKTLKKVALDVVEQVLGETLPAELQKMIFVKSYINIFNPTAESEVILPTLPVDEFAQFGDILSGVIAAAATQLPGFITVKEYDDEALGIQINLSNEFLQAQVAQDDEEEKVVVSDDSELSIAIYFNKNGLLEKAGVKGKIDIVSDVTYTDEWVENEANQKVEETTHADVDITIDSYVSFKFGEQKISFPKLEEYLPFALLG